MRLDSSIVSVRSGVSPRDRVSLCWLWRRRDCGRLMIAKLLSAVGWRPAFPSAFRFSGENTAACRKANWLFTCEGTEGFRCRQAPTPRAHRRRHIMDRNRRANGGPVATTGNGTYGQFYQRDASGGFTAGGGDLRLGSSGVPGRRVPLASSHGASAPSQNTQPFAATNSRVGQPTGESPHQIRPFNP